MNSNITIQFALNKATQALSNSTTARLDAELLLSYILNVSRTYLITWPEKILNSAQFEKLNELLARRAKGEPIAYILGSIGFWDLELFIAAGVLVPRPETEILVELALEKLDINCSALVLDLGTGSGAIALSLAKHRPKASVLAIDNSTDALAIAKTNMQKLNIKNIKFIKSNWFDFLLQSEQYESYKNKFKLIVSNPPYISENDPHLLQQDLNFEPRTALVANNNGLADLFYIIDTAKDFLANNSWLLLEHGYDQYQQVQERLKAKGYVEVASYKDLAGINRITYARTR